MDAREMGSGFSNGEWLCCSRFALSAHSSPENLLTCHLIYHILLKEKNEGKIVWDCHNLQKRYDSHFFHYLWTWALHAFLDEDGTVAPGSARCI